jgi:hypothetical protein
LFFEKNAYFYRRKLAKIAENRDHNIDPWSSSSPKPLSGGNPLFRLRVFFAFLCHACSSMTNFRNFFLLLESKEGPIVMFLKLFLPNSGFIWTRITDTKAEKELALKQSPLFRRKLGKIAENRERR